ncbi:MAG: hypothetical protein HXK04_02305 [Actinomyces graevenitzii]|nr:hypothetical protein [Actinomyces graevenitzii]
MNHQSTKLQRSARDIAKAWLATQAASPSTSAKAAASSRREYDLTIGEKLHQWGQGAIS